MEWDEIYRTAADQLGLISGSQLGAFAGEHVDGCTVARRGGFARVRRNVYRVPGAPVLPEHHLLACCLEAGPPVAVTESSALAEWGLRPSAPPRPHLLLPVGRRARPQGTVIHRTRRWREDDITTLGPLPIVTPARAILDASATVDRRELYRMLDLGRRRGIVTPEEVRKVRECFGAGRGRRVRLVDRTLADRRLDLPAGDSRGELWVLDVLTSAGYQPVHHHVVRIDGMVFELDAALLEWKIDLEFDGVGPHGGMVAFFEDPERDRVLREHGWYVSRVTAKTTAGSLLREVETEIARRSA